uniref:Formin-binding protein 1 n=1 Tax=Sphaerodactylus townsendi TaxID=933632 RepID=A0ACB8F0T5_9SAUR
MYPLTRSMCQSFLDWLQLYVPFPKSCFKVCPDGSYTEEPSQENEVKVPATDFDDEFDDEEPLPTIGTCKALYTFEGQNEGTISVTEGEMLFVIEEDKGDGWTRIRRNEDEEGYVPTSYVEVFLEKNAKGAMTYI